MGPCFGPATVSDHIVLVLLAVVGCDVRALIESRRGYSMLSAVSAHLPLPQGEAWRATPRSAVNGPCGPRPNVPSSRKAIQYIISARLPFCPPGGWEHAVPDELPPSHLWGGSSPGSGWLPG